MHVKLTLILPFNQPRTTKLSFSEVRIRKEMLMALVTQRLTDHPITGDDGGDMRTRMYINSVAILDTNTWTWTVPSTDGIPPSRRSFAAAGILDGEHLTVAFGMSTAFYNSSRMSY